MNHRTRKQPLAKRGGRPTLYRPEYAERATNYAMLGLTDDRMAQIFGVNVSTLRDWRHRYPEFAEAVARGRDEADAKVARSLYERACGYSHEAVKIFYPATADEPVYAPYMEHYPPDTTAAMQWLRLRQPHWRDKQADELDEDSKVAAIARDKGIAAVMQTLLVELEARSKRIERA